jgi:RNA polymerase sigma-70 factor, ECF subfamily
MIAHMDIFEELRPQLFSLAYRMLGTRADAEDIVQDAYLRWQNADREHVQSARSYLHAVVARLSLDALKSARHKRESYVGTWLPEPVAQMPSPAAGVEMADSLSMAFLHVLESLSPGERVAFLLREVFGAEYAEVAGVLETSEANARQLVTRSRAQMREKRPRFTVDPERHQAVLREFVTACANDNKTALMNLLRGDAVLYSDGGGRAAAALNPIFGSEKVARFFLGVRDKQPAGLRVEAASVGGVPALVFVTSAGADSLLTLDLDDEGRIRSLYVVRNPDKLGAYRT